MSAPCQTCVHPKAAEIDAHLSHGKIPVLQLAKTYSINVHSLTRHKQKHLARNLVLRSPASLIASSVAGPTSMSVEQELNNIKARAEALGQLAESNKDYRTGLLALREMRQVIETTERILAERASGHEDITTNPHWRRLQTLLVQELHTVPGAVEAIARALERHREGE